VFFKKLGTLLHFSSRLRGMVDDIGVLFELCKELSMKTEEVFDCLDIRAVGDGWINLELKSWLNDSQFKTLCKLVKKLGGMRLGSREFRIPMLLPHNKEFVIGDNFSDKSTSTLLQFF
jgi:hypothetical protein